jgi:hypothetical protein
VTDVALRAVFKRLGYRRAKAVKKLFINEARRAARLPWAIKHERWTESDWDRICWSDESLFIMCWGQVYVPRLFDEAFLPDCLVPRFRGYSEWMIWGSITQKGKGPLVFVEKDWGAGELRGRGRVS